MEICMCIGDTAISITGGYLFLSLDAGANAAYSILHEFGEIVDRRF